MRSLRALAAAGLMSRCCARAVFDTDSWLWSKEHDVVSAHDKAHGRNGAVSQESHLLAHQYGDLIKKAKLKGRMR